MLRLLPSRARALGGGVCLVARRRPLCSGAARSSPAPSPPTPPPPPPPPSAAATFATSGAIGLAAGVFGSLVGLGGGVVMVPLLTSAAGLSQHAAHGTSLVAVVSTGIGGCASFASSGKVDWMAAAAVAATASLSAVAGARATSSLSGATLKRAMGFFMMAVAPLVPLKEHIVALGRRGAPEGAEGGAEGGGDGAAAAAVGGQPLGTLLQCAGVGVLSGALSGMFGVGGGSIVTPALAVLTELPHQAVLGTTLASMVLPSALGAHTHWRMGNVATRVLPGLLGGTAVGAFVGAQLAVLAPQEALRWFFCTAFLALGAKGAFKL